MKIETKVVEIVSEKQLDFFDITNEVEELVESSGIKNGTVTVYSPHTTCAVMINHNESMLKQDLMRVLYRLVPIEERYAHDMFELTNQAESDGRSNAHSHCKAMILGSSETIPIAKGKLLLGGKQSVFFVELDGSRARDFVIQVMGTVK